MQQTSLSLSGIYAEPVPPTSVCHDPWDDCAVLEDAAEIGYPIVDSCLPHHKGGEKDRDQSYLDTMHRGSCMICLSLGTQKDIITSYIGEFAYGFEPRRPVYISVCRFPGCQERFKMSWVYDAYPKFAEHERTHFGKLRDYHCLEKGCQLKTKKFADLRRHYTVRHCTNAMKYPCPILGCKYGGDNGFTRKDKLQSHQRNVHQGKVVLGKAFRPIKPKANEDGISKPQGIQTVESKPSTGA